MFICAAAFNESCDWIVNINRCFTLFTSMLFTAVNCCDKQLLDHRLKQLIFNNMATLNILIVKICVQLNRNESNNKELHKL